MSHENFKILDVDLTIKRSIDFLSHADASDLEEGTFNTYFTFIRNEIQLIAKKGKEDKHNSLFKLLDYRISSNPENRDNKPAGYLKSNARKLINFDSLRKKSAPSIHAKINKSIDFLLHYLIHNGLVQPVTTLPLTDFMSDELVESAIWKEFPEFQKFFILFRSPKTTREFKKHIPNKWQALFENAFSDKGYRNLGNIVNCWRKVALYTNASRFSDLTTQSLNQYRKLVQVEASLPWGGLVSVLNELGSDIRLDQVKKYGADKKSRGFDYFIKTGYELDNRIHDTDRFDDIRMPELFYTSGAKETVYRVTRKKPDNISFSIGGWQSNKSALPHYRAENLNKQTPESPWIKSQMEFINSFQEKGSRDGASNSLRDLNAYIFAYLPYFFGCNKDLPYEYPDCPSKFQQAIYISTSAIVTQSLYGSNVKFPISFLSFFKEVNKDSKSESQHGKLSVIRRYFDFCIARYKGIQNYEVAGNPIDSISAKEIQGKSYRTSTNKEILELEYWLLFCEYIIAVCDALIAMIENRDFVNPKGYVSLALSGKEITALDIKMTLSNTLKMNLSRTYLDGEYKMSVISPQIPLALCVMTSSGLRLANTMWLDQNDWDIDNPDNISEYADIYVSTDKAKSEGFPSVIKRDTYKILKRFEKVAGKLANKPKSSINYKSSPQSKWGKILPLLGQGERNLNYESSASEVLTTLMYDFERQLRNNAINVGSYVGLYPPIRSRGLKEIQKEIKNGFSTSFDDYILHCAGEAPVYFTPLKPYSTVTPHSLRATLDTHLSLVLGADFVGKIMTGQTEDVVNYYSKITPERFEKVMAVKDQLIDAYPTVIGVSDMAKDIDVVQEAIEKSGIIGLDGFRLHSNASEKEYMPETINPNDVAINSTHICIHGNRCPNDIINKIGEKNCAICPVAISTTSDLIAITAQIRFHRDNILDINDKLSVNDINKTEKQTLIRMRIEECTHAANWYARYQFIVSHHTDKNGYIVLSDGCNGVQEKVEAVKKLTQGQEIFCRLQEVKSTPSLQSDLLKRKASRLSREILKQITNDSFDIPDVNAVDISRQLITKMADLHDIKPSDLEGFLKEPELDAARLLSFSVTDSLREII